MELPASQHQDGSQATFRGSQPSGQSPAAEATVPDPRMGQVGGLLGEVVGNQMLSQMMSAAYNPTQFREFLGKPEFKAAMAEMGARWQAQPLQEKQAQLAALRSTAVNQLSSSQQEEGPARFDYSELRPVGGCAHGSGRPDPSWYYEQVEPSDWKPPAPDTCVELYRKAYCSEADAAFPILWMASLAALGYAEALPLWGLILAAALLFAAGLRLFILQGAGIRAKALPGTRLMCTLVLCIELLTIGVFAWRMVPLLVDCSIQACLCLGAACTAVVLQLRCARSDPGYVPLPPKEVTRVSGALKAPEGTIQPAGGDVEAGHQATGPHMGMCEPCDRLRPLRSKHCHFCKRCTERFDHHCPVVHNCIGAGNQRLFVAYLVTLFTSQLLFLYLAALYFARALGPAHAVASNVIPGTWFTIMRAAGQMPGLSMLYLAHWPLATGNLFLIGRAALCISGNLTENARRSLSPVSHFFARLDEFKVRLQQHRVQRRHKKEEAFLQRFG
ncbi:hypothetical protein WJX73_008423 [Symbiochloris irregularis]|uniref:S-acyltransferase n=1 Tax=Symbiochloris irregularis TaxID=706552 RepID=A0AAW1PIG5_9CHLO